MEGSFYRFMGYYTHFMIFKFFLVVFLLKDLVLAIISLQSSFFLSPEPDPLDQVETGSDPDPNLKQ
jgi:hypothetical protein